MNRRIATVVVLLLLGGVLAGCGNGQNATGQPASGPDEVVTAAGPPWPAPTNVAERVALAGLRLGPMRMAEHYHPHLRVIVDGEDVPVPSNIGVDPASGAKAATGDTVVVTSNGVKLKGDPNDLRLEPDQQIVVRLGSLANG